MTWPTLIYVATTALGVYYTDDFHDPAVQPTWTAINGGLGALDCRWFALDPFSPSKRQYVLLEGSRTIYRREDGGNWTSILTSAQIAAMAGQATDAVSFCVDESVDGRLWVLAKAVGFWEPIFGLYSSDHGDTWNFVTIRAGWYTYSAYGIRSDGNNVYARINAYGGATARLYFSTNLGGVWANTYLDFNAAHPMSMNHLLPDRCYSNTDGLGNTDLQQITKGGVSTMLQDGLGFARWDAMWFHPGDALHQRLVRGAKIYATYDAWSTINAPNVIAPVPLSFSPAGGSVVTQMVVGLTLGTHVIGVLEGEADVVATGIAGTNAGAAPYADSIPAICGGLAQMGVQAVPISATVGTYAVKFELPPQDDGTVHVAGPALAAVVQDDSSVHTGSVEMEI